MNRASIVVTSLTILLSSTAAFAQDKAVPAFTLTGTGGVAAFNLPSFDTGVFGHSGGGTFVGGMIGASGTASVAKLNSGWDLFVGASVFGSWANGTSSWSDTFTGPSTVTIMGLSTPTTGSIALTSSAANATATITNTNPQTGGSTATLSASGGTNNVGAVSPSIVGNSFVLGAVATSPTTGAAYGAIADTSGGIFVGTGNVDGLRVATSLSQQFTYGGGDLTVGVAGQLNETTSIQLYAGPSVRMIGQTNTTDIQIDIPEVAPSVTTFPMFEMSRVDKLNSSYWGGSLGSNISFAAKPGVTITLGAAGSLYNVSASWRGQDTYSTCCGAFGVGSPVTGNSPSLSVLADPKSADFGGTTAYALRGNGAVTFDIDANRSVSLGGSVEYLSKVATVSHSALTSVVPGTSATWNSATSTQPAPATLSWGSMVNFGVSASFTGHF